MKIALKPNLTRVHAAETTREIAYWLRKYEAEFAVTPEIYPELSDIEGLGKIEEHDLLTWCDVVIAVGGDGSMLMAAKATVPYDKPILCINAGHLAFMAGLERNELERLKDLIDGNYKIDRRMLLTVRIKRDGETLLHTHCINDVVLARGKQLKLIDYNIDCDGRRINTYRADGVIVATPTGSSAYSLSAGGPVIDPGIEAIVVTPICAQSLFARSIVFNSNNTLQVYCDEEASNLDLVLSVDGGESIPIEKTDMITIDKATKYADFIRIKNDSFFDILNTKLAGLEAPKE